MRLSVLVSVPMLNTRLPFARFRLPIPAPPALCEIKDQ